MRLLLNASLNKLRFYLLYNLWLSAIDDHCFILSKWDLDYSNRIKEKKKQM
jgi:hypothetical protein